MSNNIIPHDFRVATDMREALNNHRGALLWFTGLSGSGKSTLAHELDLRLNKRGVHTYVLDGDNIRSGLNSDLSFSPDHRTENIRRIGEVAALFVDAALIVMTAFISPYKKDRQRVREMIPSGRFIEVYVQCPLHVAEGRDPKGLYKKARRGEIKDFTGVQAPYEEPENPELVIDTAKLSVEQAVNAIIDRLAEQNIIASIEG